MFVLFILENILVIRNANQAIKITKSNFTAKLTELLERGFLIAKN